MLCRVMCTIHIRSNFSPHPNPRNRNARKCCPVLGIVQKWSVLMIIKPSAWTICAAALRNHLILTWWQSVCAALSASTPETVSSGVETPENGDPKSSAVSHGRQWWLGGSGRTKSGTPGVVGLQLP